MIYYERGKQMSLEIAVLIAAINGDSLVPRVTESVNYKHWISVEDLRRCLICADCHGKIWPIIETSKIEPPVHHNCRCVIEVMKAIAAGTATINGTSGADWCLKYEGKLPDNYISYNDAKKQGFRTYLGNLDKIANGKMLTKGLYRNRNGHLPDAVGRTWYEADINYKGGYRNSQRIFFSNDGLIFVTYDHYQTFFEII